MTAIDSILQSGDQLEQEIFRDPCFSGNFLMYAALWDQHLRPRRTTGSLYIAGAWELFSQHHYAAIVRAWGAWNDMSTISSQVQSWSNTSADRLLLHARILSFYVHCTAVVDNLMLCGRYLATNVLEESAPASPAWWLAWETTRNQRNLEAHECLRPITDLYGKPVIDSSLLVGGTTWAKGTQTPLPIDKWVKDVWTSAVCCMARAWSDLLGMCARSPQPPPAPAPSLSAATPLNQAANAGQPSASGIITDVSGHML